MKKKRFSLTAVVVAVVVTLAVTLGGLFCAGWVLVGPEGLAILEGFALTNTHFIEPQEKAALADKTLTGLVDALGDRWSHYLTAPQYEAQQRRRANAYVGIGVTVSYEREEGLLIVALTPGGPAQEAGLLPGEVITAVDGASVAGQARESGPQRIEGEPGTVTVLEILSASGEARRQVEVTRKKIETTSVGYTATAEHIGIITVKDFYTGCAEDLKQAVDALTEQGAVGLVFDMRNNPGGYLNELTDSLDYLLPEGPIFRSRDRAGNESVTQSDAQCISLPMAVLVNGNTYSAAEFFAAELQEQGVAVVIGEPTSGKGYSQQSYALMSGGAMNLSTAAYFTGQGTSLIGTGLTLDQEIIFTQAQAAALAGQTLLPQDDTQLQAALTSVQK